MRSPLAGDHGPQDVDDGRVDFEADLDRVLAVAGLLLQLIDKIFDLVLEELLHLGFAEAELLQGGAGELGLDLPCIAGGRGQAVLAVTEEPEHEGVGARGHLFHGEALFDALVAVEDDGHLGPDPQTEDVAESLADFLEALTQVVHV